MGEGKRKPILPGIGLRGHDQLHKLPKFITHLEEGVYADSIFEAEDILERLPQETMFGYGEDSIFEDEEIAEILNNCIDPDAERILEISGDRSLNDHTDLLESIALLAKEALDGYHSGYLNSIGSKLRKIAQENSYDKETNSTSLLEIESVRRHLESINTSNPVELPHSKLYLLITYELYKEGIIADDVVTAEILDAIYQKEDLVDFDTKYLETIDRLLVLDHGSDYEAHEEAKLAGDIEKISDLFGPSVEKGNVLKAIYVLKTLLLEDNSALDYLEAAELFQKFTGLYPTPEEMRKVIDILFVKRGANKFSFLLNWKNEFGHLLTSNNFNLVALRNSLEGLIRSFSFEGNKKLSSNESYSKFINFFDQKFSILPLDLNTENPSEEDLNMILYYMEDFLLEKSADPILRNEVEWNDLSIIMFLLNYMNAQTKIPEDFYNVETGDHRIIECRDEICRRLESDADGTIKIDRLNTFETGDSDIFISNIYIWGEPYSLVLQLADIKKLDSLIPKILAGKKPKDMIRARVGIPNELPNLKGITLKDYCFAATAKLVKKLGATMEDVSSMRASLLNETESWNPFSNNLRTFKFIVRIKMNIDGKEIEVPMEIMMVLYYPKDHNMYKEKQVLSLRGDLGLSNSPSQMGKAIEYLYWRYYFDDNINEENHARLNSTVYTYVGCNGKMEFSDEDTLPMLKSLVEKFSTKIPEEMKARFVDLVSLEEEGMESQSLSEDSAAE